MNPIRPLHQQDIPQLSQTCWKNRPSDEITALIARVKHFRVQNRGDGFVVEHQYKAIGFGLLTIWTNRAEISDLIVTAPFRSQGMGTALIQHMMSTAYQCYQAQVVEIGVVSDNQRALHLYERLGFVMARTIILQDGGKKQCLHYLEKPLGLTNPQINSLQNNDSC